MADVTQEKPVTLSIQGYMTQLTGKVAADLKTAFLRLPEDKRGWSPAESSRTALDMMAECALLNGSATDLIKSRQWTADMSAFFAAKSELAQSWSAAEARFDENTAVLLETISSLPDVDLSVEVAMPWGNMTMAQIISYPLWNMSYHEGQINYIASILGCLA